MPAAARGLRPRRERRRYEGIACRGEVGHDRYASAILLRAKGLHASDEARLGVEAAFEQMECPSGGSHGLAARGADRHQAQETFEASARPYPRTKAYYFFSAFCLHLCVHVELID
jgi:hypothetical protein